ncbi:MAG: TetR/AcrR family transcriptional regulator [Methylibium sp.]|uniref:Transcriptional regulator, TetR family n=2 Tax=Methylibium TaxID=316612 RepID=A2SEW1_METPP|nr:MULTISPECIES: TetR/AcrR family transcriptional regulator [Methylibium]ABM94100.1 transcriptional regulator, TetR family [Methylibium petroleiphilum PM1]EWS60335.1 putative HTH-type transcriptional regulator TtgW [Methylibium sp. T29-B]
MSDWLDPLLTRTDDPVSGGAPAGRDKRTLIVEAALDVLLTDGIGKLSMRRVAREAGVALGLAHYYFASKGELIAALVGASAHRLHAEGPPETGDAAGPGAWLGRAEGLVTADRVRLSADIDSAALRDPVVAEAAAQRHRDAESEMGRQLAAITATAAVELGDLPSLSAVLAAALDGLAVRALIDPSFDLPAAHAALQHLLQARLASQAGAAPRRRTAATS